MAHHYTLAGIARMLDSDYKGDEYCPRMHGVRLDWVKAEYASRWRAIGIGLSVNGVERSKPTVQRRVLFDKNGLLDIEKLKTKYNGLVAIAVGYNKLRDEQEKQCQERDAASAAHARRVAAALAAVTPWTTDSLEQGAVQELLEAATELLEVADLRGDSDLPHPSNDPYLWTARMQTAWDEIRAALAKLQPQADARTEA